MIQPINADHSKPPMKPNHPLHILFVDDDPDESYLFNEALEHTNYNVKLSYAKDGNNLISYLNANPLPDLIFLDINMPYKDGIEALTDIKNNPAFAHLPVIIYSTSKNDSSINRSYEKGADLYVIKPSDFEGMVYIVKAILNIDWKFRKRIPKEEFLLTADKPALDRNSELAELDT
ncbi:MAG: response regulator with Che-like receiver domain [Segetibacter sp.]|nr:response regulator with Che-like receiver domain [Segetibacter sp.]